MKEKQKKQLTHWLSVAVIGIALGLGLQFVRAWTEPSQAPPGGNLGAPINTGAQSQTKSGGITAGTLTAATVTGTTQLCIGTDCRTAWPSGETTTTTTGCYCTGYCPCGTTVQDVSTDVNGAYHYTGWLCDGGTWVGQYYY